MRSCGTMKDDTSGRVRAGLVDSSCRAVALKKLATAFANIPKSEDALMAKGTSHRKEKKKPKKDAK